MARHRSPEPRPTRDYLPLIALLAGAIAVTGVVTSLVLADAPAPPAPVPPVISVSAAPSLTEGPRSTEQVWASCQARATNSEHPGEAATECMIDWQLGQFMTCLTSKKTCPTTTPVREGS